MRTLAAVAALALGLDIVPGPPRPSPASGTPASPQATPGSAATLQSAVRERERAFAKTMADRDLTGFATFVSEEAVFVGRSALRGRRAVVEGWKGFFDGPRPPFSWSPELVEVVDSGSLALSRGPVFAPDGTRTGTFTSTWRLEKDGQWRIVLDSGCPPCRCGSEPTTDKQDE
jgi:ketosteroid isomerase-like protein